MLKNLNNMSDEMKLLEIKVKIKKWELDFAKKCGFAPKKEDIDKNVEAKKLYIQYARLKNSKGKRQEESNNQNGVTNTGIWGEKLLKCNSPSVPKSEKAVKKTQVEDDENMSKLVTYSRCRENLRKNLSSQSLSPLPTSINHRQRTTIKNTLQSQPVYRESDLAAEEMPAILPEVKKVATPVVHTRKTPCRKPLGLKQDIESKKIRTKCIDISWLDDNTEDLSNLLQIQNKNFKLENDMPDIEYNDDKPSDVTQNQPTHDSQHSSKHENKDDVVCGDFNEANLLSNTNDKMDSTNDKIIPESTDSKPVTKMVSKDNKNETDIPSQVKCNFSAGGTSNSGSSNKRSSNTNFIRLNMKQKCFSKRGKGRFLRKQVYREKLQKKGYSFRSGWKGRSGGAKSEFRDRSEDKCFKCGEHGHWASKCKNQPNFKGSSKKSEVNLNDEEPTEFLMDVIEKSQMMDGTVVYDNSLSQRVKLECASPVYNSANYDRTEVKDALKKFGFTDFRKGQEEAIKRILCGQPTLLVLSTGSGKSLCYQLPAHLYSSKQQSITLVVSPLVSLMDDQVHGLPKFLKATRLHSGMTKDQREKVMKEIEARNVDILLVSPEALMKWAGMPPRYSPLSQLPPISFVCIDECHCLAEWSHSFRPSYLRVCEILKEQLGVKCLVGLTATATMTSCHSVAKQLGIQDKESGMIIKMDLPPNLNLSISRDKYKDESLEQLLMGKRFGNLDSIIIYCTRRDDVSRVSSFLRTKLQTRPSPVPVECTANDTKPEEQNTRKRKRGGSSKGAKRKAIAYEADCYHAGMSAAERRRVQNRFMSGQLRIVVATVAFGMGIDKHDVRGVIHYNMPRSFERYVQEVGRAGRDGLPAHCHLFLDADGGDLFELGRHTYGKTVDRYTVKQLVRSLFRACHCQKLNQECEGHFAAIPIDESVEKLDVSKEGIETLMCYLELDGHINVYLPTETTCSIRCYGGPSQMVQVAKKCPAVARAISTMDKVDASCSNITFSLVQVADLLKCDLSSLKKNLRQLVWDSSLSTGGSAIGKSGVDVEFKDVSFLVKTKRAGSDDLIDSLTASLHQRVVRQELKELFQLRTAFNTMQRYSHPNIGYCMDEADMEKSENLKQEINTYFKADDQIPEVQPAELDEAVEADVRAIVRQFLTVHSADFEGSITGRAVARILHGIDSPRYPARTWGPARRFWRSKMNVDFNALLKLATAEILKFR